MGTAQTRMPVVSALPLAYFVTGDTGLKQTTEVNWDSVYLNAEEIAAIVPVPIAVLQDSGFDAERDLAPFLREAIGRTLDAAIFFGTNKPASWPADIAAGRRRRRQHRDGRDRGGSRRWHRRKTSTMSWQPSRRTASMSTACWPIAPSARRCGACVTATGQKLLDVTNNTVEGDYRHL